MALTAAQTAELIAINQKYADALEESYANATVPTETDDGRIEPIVQTNFNARAAGMEIVAYFESEGITVDDLKTAISGSHNDTYIDLGVGNWIYDDKATGFEPAGGDDRDVNIEGGTTFPTLDDLQNGTPFTVDLSNVGSSSLIEQGDEGSFLSNPLLEFIAAALAPVTGGTSIILLKAAQAATGETLTGEDYIQAVASYVSTNLDVLGDVNSVLDDLGMDTNAFTTIVEGTDGALQASSADLIWQGVVDATREGVFGDGFDIVEDFTGPGGSFDIAVMDTPAAPELTPEEDGGGGSSSTTASTDGDRTPTGTFVDDQGRLIGWDAQGQFVIDATPQEVTEDELLNGDADLNGTTDDPLVFGGLPANIFTDLFGITGIQGATDELQGDPEVGPFQFESDNLETDRVSTGSGLGGELEAVEADLLSETDTTAETFMVLYGINPAVANNPVFKAYQAAGQIPTDLSTIAGTAATAGALTFGDPTAGGELSLGDQILPSDPGPDTDPGAGDGDVPGDGEGDQSGEDGEDGQDGEDGEDGAAGRSAFGSPKFDPLFEFKGDFTRKQNIGLFDRIKRRGR